MAKKILFKLKSFKPVRRRAWTCPRWTLHGETIEGDQVSMTTGIYGNGELRWNPKSVVGETLRVTYHLTRNGNMVADLWRPSWAEGEDLGALFAQERTKYLVEQERQALVVEVATEDWSPPRPKPSIRL
jgi:hypothetical protein